MNILSSATRFAITTRKEKQHVVFSCRILNRKNLVLDVKVIDKPSMSLKKIIADHFNIQPNNKIATDFYLIGDLKDLKFVDF